MNQKLRTIFGLDLRSLAAFRIGMGVLLLVDLANRATDMVAHYTDFGVMPRESVSRFYGDAWRWSLHSLSGDLPWQIALFSLSAICAICLLLGCWTRVATIASWIFLASIQTRIPLVSNGGDSLFRLLLFWSMFLPLGAFWSIDSWRKSKRDAASSLGATDLRPSTNPVFSAGSVAIILQICIMYWATGWFKWNESWLSGKAMSEILAFDSYARPLASHFLDYPNLLKWISWGTLVIELGGPLLLFCPWRTPTIRLLVIGAFAALHIGIEMTLTVGLFSWASLLAWSVLLPCVFWDFLATILRKKETGGEQKLAPERAEGLAEGALGQSETRTSGSWQRPYGVAWQAFAGVLLVYVVAWNTLTLLPKSKDPDKQHEMPKPLARIGQLFQLHQKWVMFMRPPRSDGWYVILARLDDGRSVDLIRGGSEAGWDSWDKPDSIISHSKNHRWRKYRRLLRTKKTKSRRRDYCKYLVRQWDVDHPDGPRINRLELCYMQETDAEDTFSQRTLYTLRLHDVETPEYLKVPDYQEPPETVEPDNKSEQKPEGENSPSKMGEKVN